MPGGTYITCATEDLIEKPKIIEKIKGIEKNIYDVIEEENKETKKRLKIIEVANEIYKQNIKDLVDEMDRFRKQNIDAKKTIDEILITVSDFRKYEELVDKKIIPKTEEIETKFYTEIAQNIYQLVLRDEKIKQKIQTIENTITIIENTNFTEITDFYKNKKLIQKAEETITTEKSEYTKISGQQILTEDYNPSLTVC